MYEVGDGTKHPDKLFRPACCSSLRKHEMYYKFEMHGSRGGG